MNTSRSGVRLITPILAALVLVATYAPVFAAKVVTKPIQHGPLLVYQAYPGWTCDGAGNTAFQGFSDDGTSGDAIGAVPGVLAIEPGGTQPLKGWPSYVSASGPAGPSDKTWTVTNVSLRKIVPSYVCTVSVGSLPATQHGSANIQYWWPLMYELPGTQWTLTITYKTSVWDDDGPGPNPPATTHQDVWIWKVDATLDSMQTAIKLFHELPVGSGEVPLINGESMYAQLLLSLDKIQSYPTGSVQEITDDLCSLILLIEDCCLTVDCGSSGSEIGIRNTLENPACCVLLADADYVVAPYSLASAP